jgi:Ca2+-binding EF-hand superfamily protein
LEELEIGMRALGVAPPSPEALKRDLGMLFHKMDLDHDGKIQLAEFKFFYQERKKELRVVFDKLDENVDGRVTSAEIAAAIQRVDLKVSSNQLRELMKRLDTNNSGRISFTEFGSSLLLLPSVNPEAVFDKFLEATPVEVAQGEYNLPKDNPKDLEKPRSKNSMWVEIGHQLYYGGVAGIAR